MFLNLALTHTDPDLHLDLDPLPVHIFPPADSDAGAEFAVFKDEWEPKGCGFHSDLASVPAPSGPRLALIAGRTADNPKLLREVISQADLLLR